MGAGARLVPFFLPLGVDSLSESFPLYACIFDRTLKRTDETETANLLNENRKRTRSGDAFTPSDSAGRITTEMWKLIGSLRDEVKHNQHILQEQNEKLHEELKALQARIEAAPPTAPARSWAEVAAGGSNVDPRDNENTDGNTFARYLSIEAAYTHIQTALTNAVLTQDAQLAGVGTTKRGYVVRFKDPESAGMARTNTEWLEKMGNNTKLVKPRFGVVVHRTPTEDLNLETDYNQVIEKITEENDPAERGYCIEGVAWLKRADKAVGKFASLGIWLDSPEGGGAFHQKGLRGRQTVYRERGATWDQEKDVLPMPTIRTPGMVVAVYRYQPAVDPGLSLALGLDSRIS
ncbi:hypothetical protein N7537_011393 [Penicillium hordei]|uniref:Uncharacterized protein n=1 Tax=Penicillium hordei TaxID=40994 RepID=A0AAD6DMB9_9EURO|nr:uncharacterized protein N7537_011393 [Penicillium hordei]KAJ5588715.1 hypothetical protein N7537_011393 [Penicillium hordei]